ncbi:hypothetical protein B0T20DRAFT_466375 [Sordaria brevicollis]|uniref:Uncharacterized protein n=1 Tax=Sordaria brevicollis TaxID=83679 RepID=A0AAE0PJP5_SORBR|nr:hypothetical protein B0T20DRAFT_466375 [Sordaria brevicollis]
MKQTTLLDVVKDCDNFPYPCFPSSHSSSSDSHSRIMSTLWTFHLPCDPAPHGLMTQTVVENMPWTKHFELDAENRAVNMLPPSAEDLIPEDNGSWETACNRLLDEQIEIARQDQVLSRILGKKKKGEQFPIVGALFDVGVDRDVFKVLFLTVFKCKPEY